MSQKVSICIASYNMADTIAESLTSILEHLPDDYELVIVDESDDGSREVIESLDIENPLQKVYVSDLGFSASITRAVKEATGNIVLTHVDMDDWYDSRYFESFVELYTKLRDRRDGRDFWFSCPNFNITSRESYLNEYRLKQLPMGAGEREYKWRLVTDGDFLRVNVNKEISRRIRLSEKKNLVNRGKRTLGLAVGLFQIGYSVRRMIEEEALDSTRPIYSQLFFLLVIPFAYLISWNREHVESSVSKGGEPLEVRLERNTYTLEELREEYDLKTNLKIDSLVNTD